MANLTIEILKKLIENIPEDFTVEFSSKTTTVPVTDRVEIDVSSQRLILK